MYEQRLAFLEETHRSLENQITKMIESGNTDDAKISELKEKTLQLRSEISRLRRLDWEDKHERVEFDDDR